jgi:acyl carrier protein
MNEPISRDQIVATLRKHVIATIDGVTEETIANAKTLGDIGASSLDIVEIVSSTMRELKIKVPRSELMLIETLDELVDLLHQRAVAAPQMPPPPAAQ